MIGDGPLDVGTVEGELTPEQGEISGHGPDVPQGGGEQTCQNYIEYGVKHGGLLG